MQKTQIIISFLLAFILLPSFASANVVINEIAWMGTENSANDEWIELYNAGEGEIDLTDWTLKAADGSPEILLEGIIPALGYFLLERMDDESVPNVLADLIYSGALNNSRNKPGENLELQDDQGNLIDSVNCSDGWFAGDNETKQTMERNESGWQTSLDVGGTPKAENSAGETEENEEDNQEPESETEQTETNAQSPIDEPAISFNRPPLAEAGPDTTALAGQEIVFDSTDSLDMDGDTLTYFWNFGDGATDTEIQSEHTYLYPGQYIVSLLVSDGEFSDLDIITVNVYSPSIIISEFFPNPEGDGENEWVELFNKSGDIANLSGWMLDDMEGESKPFVFPDNTLIAPNQFLVLKRTVTKISLNNDYDQVRLFYPNGSIASRTEYNGQEGQSVAFDGNEYFWTVLPTPGLANIISAVETDNKQISFKNNPAPIARAQKSSEETVSSVILNSKFYAAANSDSEETDAKPETATNHADGQTTLNQNEAPPAHIASVLSSEKNNLILIISVIISASFLIGWLLILLKKKLIPVRKSYIQTQKQSRAKDTDANLSNGVTLH